ncbi:hypothetical protein BDZ94DRAFT_1153659 [Collybia nuda]|uniref:MATH domain-containing protein n=1 Tax=Collybia nuda TaxID=64659 RepID=A0A9P5YEQ2_9AGAR|nr:hypothetical protein BDZ94DRAFT_1153659 [Collybia nuda]
MDLDSEYQESVSITFEWTLKGLKNLFESTKGDSKSKVTKSARFGGGRWQILFYPNAGLSKEGTTEGGFVSLYLSCEPTPEEKEMATANSGRWVREGVYKFSFEIRNGKSPLSHNKEAHNHSFSHKTANWGWAQFAKRDTVYSLSAPVKTQDFFVIICTITSSPSPPVQPPSTPYQSVPKSLLDTVGALLDDPTYSDVEFIIPRRGQNLRLAQRIWASRKLLRRAEYFDTMFSSGFAESTTEGSATPRIMAQSAPSVIESESNLALEGFEDSDDSGDESVENSQLDLEFDSSNVSGPLDILSSSLTENAVEEDDYEHLEDRQRNVRAKLSHPSSPRSSHSVHLPRVPESSSSSKVTIVIKDVAYNTYLALLYYIYTDAIVFAPLSSSFILGQSQEISETPNPTLPSTPSEPQSQTGTQRRNTLQDTATSRREWINEWREANPGRPAPCSAKSAYRLADRLDLHELKERASQHIIKSLSVHNIAYEVFSPFAAAFEEIRKIQVDFFLSHWQEIRASDSMRNVWQQIRNGRHPGFEEVWPVIASNLEFKVNSKVLSGNSPATGDVSR